MAINMFLSSNITMLNICQGTAALANHINTKKGNKKITDFPELI